MSFQLPSVSTLQYATKLAIIKDKPILYDYYVESLKKNVCIGKVNGTDKILVKSNCQEYTSPIKDISQVDDKTKKKLYNQIKEEYEKQSDCRYAAARMWVDEIILPNETRNVLIEALDVINHQDEVEQSNFGILQV